MAIQQEWFTVEEAAEYLRVSRRTIYKLCQQGQLPAHRATPRGHRRFRKDDLDGAMTKVVALTAKADPVLAELWDNELDAVYDRL